MRKSIRFVEKRGCACRRKVEKIAKNDKVEYKMNTLMRGY